ncbi:CYTH and CHAD domain-containing protein [Indioceanicola profundi]|uniref:CYTH and CHAD domain-containing protein n=1 Tax=Indioceanicola profundi TaxID=2220096 RepID=UPI000E6ACF5E|nr:CYTH and CHAD domain-containing protein [Indioceanicola profundi]
MSGQEIELKLKVDPADFSKLRDAPLPGQVPEQQPVKTLESTYFDTPDVRLHALGWSLRVRKSGRNLVQTLKSPGTATGGVVARGEWECPVSTPHPDLAALPDQSVLAELGPLDPAELKPLFTTKVKRTIRIAKPSDGTEIEIALDQGEVVTPEGRTLPLNEAELEMKSGDPASIYDLALALNEAAPLRVELQSKAERGYALALDERPSWFKAGRLDLSPDQTAEEVLQIVVRHCMHHMVSNEAVALAGEQPEGIHQMRVALRRLRSALALFEPLIPAEQYEHLVGEVRWLATAFGAARDWDVFLSDLLAPVEAAFPGDREMAALAEAARTCREQGYRGAREAILSRRYTALLLKVGAWVDGRGWRNQPVSEKSARLLEPITALSGELLGKRHKQSRKRGKGFAKLGSEQRHRVRISLKKLRYASEFFRSLYDQKAVRRYTDELAALQETLGHLQDVATVDKLVGTIREELGADAPAGWEAGAGLVRGWHARGLHDLEPRLIRDWEAFTSTRPFWVE